MKRARRAAAVALALIILQSALPAAANSPASRVAAAVSGIGPSDVMLVVDVSGSMNDSDGKGVSKLNGAKSAVIALLDGLPSRVHVGLRTYPAPGSDCGAGRLEADVFAGNDVVGQKVRALKADGGTPTALALTAAAEDLRAVGSTNGNGVIVLVSDGESNCGQDPCAVARAIRASGTEVTVNTIGFKISTAGAKELNCIANATGGEYRDAADAGELIDTLGALAGSSIRLDVSAPKTVVRSVGLGQNPTVDIRADVVNVSPNPALNLRAQILVTSARRPFVLNPVRQLGNLAASEARQLVWSFTPPLDFADTDVSFTVEVSGDNIATRATDVRISLNGTVSLSDAGPLLKGKSKVVILGDSYSAGEGAGAYIDGFDTDANPCHRSALTYGQALWGGQRENLACSGAVMADFSAPQHDATPPQFDQLQKLSYAPDLVLMSIGGNDAQFADVIVACLLPFDCHEKRVVSEVACGSNVTLATADLTADIIARSFPAGSLAAGQPHCFQDHGSYGDLMIKQAEALVGRLAALYIRVDEILNSPNRLAARGGPAPIVVMAYPSPIPDPTRYDKVVKACGQGLSYAEWKWVTDFHAALNATVASAVGVARAAGVPIYFAKEVAHSFEPSHSICDDDRYINKIDPVKALDAAAEYAYNIERWVFVGLLPGTHAADRKKSEFFHPNPLGYQAMTAALVQYSLTPDAHGPVTRDRPPPLTVQPLPRGPDIKVAQINGATLPSGTIKPLKVMDLQPGSALSVTIESTPRLLDTAVASPSGEATLQLRLDSTLASGSHDLTVTGIRADGYAFSETRRIRLEARPSLVHRTAPYVALVAATTAIAALCALYLLTRRVRGRAPLAV